MPPYCAEYLGGLPSLMISGKCLSASSSHHVTCARMSFTDQSPMTPGSVSCESDKPVYDSLNSVHALSSFFRRCCLSMVSCSVCPCSLSMHVMEEGKPARASQSMRVPG